MFPYSLADGNYALTKEKHSGVRAISNLHLNWKLTIVYDGKSTWKSHDE